MFDHITLVAISVTLFVLLGEVLRLKGRVRHLEEKLNIGEDYYWSLPAEKETAPPIMQDEDARQKGDGR